MPAPEQLSGSRQRGAGLIEVAISLLLLAVGALGLANVQIAAKRLGFEALQRTEAAALAMDLLERMRANRAGLERYQTTGIGEGQGDRLSAPARNCDRQTCRADERGDWDLWQWEASLNGYATRDDADTPVGGLVTPVACVEVRSGMVTLDIAWQGYQPLSTGTVVNDCGAGVYGPDNARRQLLRISSYVGRE